MASPKSSNYYSKIIATIWLVFVAGLLALILYVYAVSINFLNLFGELPDFRALENPKSVLASEVYSEDNVLMGKYFLENRSPVDYPDLPQNLIDALIATEDIRFEEHSGIDFKGSFAVIYYKLTGKQDRGSSTLTQQLARNLFRTRTDLNKGLLSSVPGFRMLIIKTKEWIMAIRLERSYSKKEILLMYLNTVDFGSGAYGIKSAAKTFFNKAPKDLKLQESAVLVGLLKGPSYFSPVKNTERSQLRRNTVIDQMQKYGFIQPEEAESAKNTKIALNYHVENQNSGMAPYFRTELGKFLLRWCKENGYNLYEDGLKIYTTIDSRMQQYAEEAVRENMQKQQKLFANYWMGRQPWTNENGATIKGFLEQQIKLTDRYKSLDNRYEGNKDSINYYLHKKIPMKVFTWEAPGEKEVVMSPLDSLAYYKRFLNTGFMAMNPLDGHIKAWVGGNNYKYFKYDHVKQGRRQPGSTFKPVTYLAAIDNGYSPCYEVMDVPVTFPAQDGRPAYTPKNDDNVYSGRSFNLREALAFSKNTVTAHLVQKLTPQVIVNYAKRLGFSSEIDPVPAVGFGSSDVSLYELCGAYGTFVNKGKWIEPVYLTRIEDKNGNLLLNFVTKSRDVISEETAYLMVHLLKGGADIKGGTSYYGLRFRHKLKNEIGAKTGTTSNYSDAWFMAITPDLVCGSWVGGENRSIHFRSAAYGQGNKLALPTYGLFMQKVLADKSIPVNTGPFPKPTAPLSVEIDCAKYNNPGIAGDSINQEQILNPEIQLDEGI
ncbi:penicillin-binding protein 1A [Adhaeribacter radiodurans]|uniref:Transglycosylase domain-containing protein n=1 Tax=Adhaeribacter radiodurans TaxID=2745197 RepID=A0A7L7L2T2_9BACT|nr:transglycosylase domain-containing protein [Adhaeribacter radiodurans]QMU26895.1 transglycosylase domain-containing protein [Adhaeribacter radiodurans]